MPSLQTEHNSLFLWVLLGGKPGKYPFGKPVLTDLPITLHHLNSNAGINLAELEKQMMDFLLLLFILLFFALSLYMIIGIEKIKD